MKRLFQIIFLLMVIGCSSDQASIKVMSEPQMVDFLIDLHLAEGGIQDLRLKKDSAAVVFAAQEKLLFKRHDITDSVFIKSYNYYLEHPGQLEKIYSAVIDSLSLRQVLLKESGEE